MASHRLSVLHPGPQRIFARMTTKDAAPTHCAGPKTLAYLPLTSETIDRFCRTQRQLDTDMDLEFHFDFGSPNAYLSHLVIPEIEVRLGQKITYQPVLLGGVFKATNNRSPAESLQGILNKPEYTQRETQRFLKAHAITSFQQNPHFPVNTLMLMRGAIFAESTDYFERYVNEVYHHMWHTPQKLDDPDVFHAALIASGLPADEIFAGTQLPEVKARLIANTEASVARGNFGSPSFFAGAEMFFGKDKLAAFEAYVTAQS